MKNKIITDLSDNYRNDEAVIEELINDYKLIAANASNRNKDDELLEPYICKAVKSVYLLRGDEGKTSSSEGGLSSSYEDIEKKLRKDVLCIRKGNF